MTPKSPRTKSPTAKTSKPKASKPKVGQNPSRNLKPSGKDFSSEDMVELIQSLPEADRLKMIQVVSTSFTVPLPHPDHFEKYNLIQPGAADRILAMAEIGQQNRAKANDKTLANERIRIIVAGTVALVMLGIAGIATVSRLPPDKGGRGVAFG